MGPPYSEPPDTIPLPLPVSIAKPITNHQPPRQSNPWQSWHPTTKIGGLRNGKGRQPNAKLPNANVTNHTIPHRFADIKYIFSHETYTLIPFSLRKSLVAIPTFAQKGAFIAELFSTLVPSTTASFFPIIQTTQPASQWRPAPTPRVSNTTAMTPPWPPPSSSPSYSR